MMRFFLFIFVMIFFGNQGYANTILPGKIYAWTSGDGSFTDLLNIPEGFFGPGTGGFSGDINLKSNPVYNFENSHVVGTEEPHFVDTVIVFEHELADTGIISIHMELLSLKTVNPIFIEGIGFIDVFVSLSDSKVSSGHVNVTVNNKNGGLFNTFLDVYPKFTFFLHETGDFLGEVDTGKLSGIKPVEIRGKDSVWSHQVLEGNTIIGDNTTN